MVIKGREYGSLLNRLIARSIVAIVCFSGIDPMAARADSIKEFYAGTQIRFIISAGTGGGYDMYGRVFARHFGSHVPGQPKVVPQNMPGAGGIRAASFLFNTAGADGLTMGLLQSGTVLEPLLGKVKDQFNPVKFNWIGNLEEEPSLCVSWHAAPIKTFEDLQNSTFVVGGTGAGDTSEMYPKVLNAALGTDIKIISGYKGGNDVVLAMERGEIQGRCGWPLSSIRSTRPDWIKDGKLKFLIQLGTRKHADLPQVPLIMDLVASRSQRRREALTLIFAGRQVLRPILVPPGVPAQRVAALRQAFNATMKDEAFLKEIERHRLTISPAGGDDVQSFIEQIYQMSPAVVVEARGLLGQ
jgi:tripartite-type tricarboxylate transporter receptor subunit TctC